MENFGTLLRNYRLHCKDPKNHNRPLTQQKLGELIGDEMGMGVGYSGATVSYWESGASKIHQDDRLVLTKTIAVLHKYGGIVNINEANTLLSVGNYRSLDEKEAETMFSSKITMESPIAKPQIDVEEQPSNLWPPGIPDEEYYRLPHREEELTILLKLIENNDGPQLISIDGLGGMGKTSLAAELARRCINKGLFQGVIGETAKLEMLSGNEIIPLQAPILNYENLLDALARQLQLWDLFTRDLSYKETTLSQILRRDRYFLILDNLETVENANSLVVRLRNILGASRAIITSRVKVNFDIAHSFTLENLVIDDAFLFIRSTADKLDVKQIQKANKNILLEMCKLAGGSPLAMKLAVAQAKFIDLDYILSQMRKANTNLYFFIFKESWQQLSDSAQSILVYIGKTAVETVGLQELVATGLGKDEDEVVKSINQLIAYSLLNVSFSGKNIRYGIHQLTRQFIVQDLPVIWKEQGLF